jgi:hypothetical protein
MSKDEKLILAHELNSKPDEAPITPKKLLIPVLEDLEKSGSEENLEINL